MRNDPSTPAIRTPTGRPATPACGPPARAPRPIPRRLAAAAENRQALASGGHWGKARKSHARARAARGRPCQRQEGKDDEDEDGDEEE
eukprot:2919780-Pyramimonas_sp.AAC.1